MVAVFCGTAVQGLGRRTGNERRPDPFARRRTTTSGACRPADSDRTRPARADDPVASPRNAPARRRRGRLRCRLGDSRIRGADPQFIRPRLLPAPAPRRVDSRRFASGMRKVCARSSTTRSSTISTGAIKARQQPRRRCRRRLVGITSVDLSSRLKVAMPWRGQDRIRSDQRHARRRRQESRGRSSTVAAVTDIGLFARNTRSARPAWTLIAHAARTDG